MEYKMIYIECPENYNVAKDELSLFIAGGITGCEDWQEQFVRMLKDDKIVLLNPRRKSFPENVPNISEQQIKWEYVHLRRADAVSFWFTKETLCPITLFELGRQLMYDKPIFIGIHPDYKRKEDVEIQVRLMRPEISVVYDLESLSSQVKDWLRKRY